jgi:tetratricopeptide (TPR) repeat protein
MMATIRTLMLTCAVAFTSFAGLTVVRGDSSGSSVIEQSPSALLADQFVLLAGATLSSDGELRPDQWTRAKVLLDLALVLKPGDPELWRLRKELADHLGDSNGGLAALQQYSRLTVGDDAAQLELVLRGTERVQTLDQRIAGLNRILDTPSAAGLSASLRSRLSSLAAGCAREVGDTGLFLKRLRDAIKLDRTNKDAVGQTLDWLINQSAPLQKVSEAITRLVAADPLNAEARRSLAEMMLSQGAYADAEKQFAAAHDLILEPFDSSLLSGWVFSLAASGRADEALRLLSDIESIRSKSQPVPSVSGQGDSDQLALNLELLRLAIYSQTNQSARAEGSFSRIAEAIASREPIGPASDPLAAGDAGLNDLEWIAALFNQKLEAVHPSSGSNPKAALIAAWKTLKAGKYKEARDQFVLISDHEPYALYGIALSYPEPNDPKRLSQLHQVIASSPDSMAALLAAMDLIKAGTKPPPSAQGQSLAGMVSRWPAMMVSPNPKQVPWLSLDITVEPARYTYLAPMTARVTLRNLTDMPLGIGPQGSIPARLFVYFSLRTSGQNLKATLPIVVDLQRRLCLKAREALTVEVRLDRSEFGSLLALNPTGTFSFDATAVFDPKPTMAEQSSGFTTGPLGVTDTAYLIERKGVAPTQSNIDQWIVDLKGSDPMDRMPAAACLVLLSVSLDQSNAPEMKALAVKMADALNQAYVGLDPLTQAWVMRFIPQSDRTREMFGAIIQIASRSEDPNIRVMYLATQVSDPDSNDLNAALRHSRPEVVEFAQAIQGALEGAAKGSDESAGAVSSDNRVLAPAVK